MFHLVALQKFCVCKRKIIFLEVEVSPRLSHGVPAEWKQDHVMLLAVILADTENVQNN